MRRLGNYCLRRLVFAPLMPLGFVLALFVTLVAVPLSLVTVPLLAAAHGEKRRWRFLRVSTVSTIYLFCETLCLICCFGLWVTTGFGFWLHARWAVRAHRWILATFLSLVLGCFRRFFGFRVALEEPHGHPGDILRADHARPVVVLARHAGPGASFALIHQLIGRYHRHVRVVLKDQLRLDPSIDLLLTRTGCAWLGTGEGGADRVAAVAGDLREREALVLFPEGADWTPVRHLQAVARLRGRGKVREARRALRMPHVLPPRPAGTLAALHNSPGSEVLIFTHTGHDQLLDASSSWAALPLQQPLQMMWWAPPPSEVPHDDEAAVLAWLQEIWAGIDSWIGARQAA